MEDMKQTLPAHKILENLHDETADVTVTTGIMATKTQVPFGLEELLDEAFRGHRGRRASLCGNISGRPREGMNDQHTW